MNTNTNEINKNEMNLDEQESVNGGSDKEANQKIDSSLIGRWLKHLINH